MKNERNMSTHQKVLVLNCGSGFHRTLRFQLGDFFGPVDLGLHLSGKYNSLNMGIGLLAGSVFPGSNRMVFTGFSPCWGGFYISSMGGAGLVFDDLGINLLSLVGKAPTPSIVCLHRAHGEEIQVEIAPLDLHQAWKMGDGGIYGLMDYTLERFGERYETDPRILVTGPAAEATDFGAIASVPIKKGKLSPVDTWAGRGGFGSKMLRETYAKRTASGQSGSLPLSSWLGRGNVAGSHAVTVRYGKRIPKKHLHDCQPHPKPECFSLLGI